VKEVRVLLSDAEAQWLETVAATKGVTLEHWCRERLLELAQQVGGYVVRTDPPKKLDPSIWPLRPAIPPTRKETDRNFPAPATGLYGDQDDIPTKPDHRKSEIPTAPDHKKPDPV
jgi:hypothetical protein